jgi:hypothetical protein
VSRFPHGDITWPKKKIKLVWAEVERRGLEKHKLTAEDIMVAAAIGLGPGMFFLGLDGGIAELLAPDAVNATIPTGGSGARQVVEQALDDVL